VDLRISERITRGERIMRSSNSIIRLSLGLALLAGLAAVPAEAQGRGQQKKAERADSREQQRPELIRRGDVWETQQRGKAVRDQGPPFCRNGQGHPVHGRQWCVDKGYGLYGSTRIDSRGTVYDSRRGNDRNRNVSYEEAHLAFHRDHDRRCRDRAAQRPLDVQWQLQVRNECRQRHDEWHRRMGRAH
jgi:hypothetical protein